MCNQVGICALLVLVQGIDDNELKVRGGGGGGGGGRLNVRHEETNERIVEEDKAIGQTEWFTWAQHSLWADPSPRDHGLNVQRFVFKLGFLPLSWFRLSKRAFPFKFTLAREN